MKKIKPTIIIFLILVLCVVVYLFTFPKWETYSDSHFGFKFIYPPQYQVVKYPFFGGITVKVAGPDPDVTYFEVQVFEPYEPVEMEAPDDSYLFSGPYPKKVPPNEKNGEQTIIERELNNISGVEAFGSYDEGTNFSDSFHFKNRGYEWRISLNPVGEGRIVTMPWDYPGHPFVFNKDIYLKIRDSFSLI